jgi:hypothetical protein
MEEATRPRARGSEPMSRRCHERAYARRVYRMLLGVLYGRAKGSYIERYVDAEVRWETYLPYDLRHNVL